MKRFILIVAVIIIAILAALAIQHQSGYVILHLNNTQVEMSFWTACLALVVTFIILYFILRVLGWLFGLSNHLRKKRRLNHARNARKLSDQGTIDAINGRWQSAHTNFEKSIKLRLNKFLPKIMQATAAHHEGNPQKRDQILASIDIKKPEDYVTLNLVKAKLMINKKDWEHALPCLNDLHLRAPEHPHVAFIRARVLVQLKEWTALNKALPTLRKDKTINKEKLHSWECECAKHQLQNCAEMPTRELWKSLHRDIQNNACVKKIYIQRLIKDKEHEAARDHLLSFLKKNWDPVLVYLLPQCADEQADQLILIVEKWMQKHPHSVALKEVLATLCYQANRLVRAKEILQGVIAEKPSPYAYQTLAKVYMAGNEWQQAAEIILQQSE